MIASSKANQILEVILHLVKCTYWILKSLLKNPVVSAKMGQLPS